MPIEQSLLNDLTCCLGKNEHGHIINEPLLLKCGCNACKSCAYDVTCTTFKCHKCNVIHERKDLLSSTRNKIAETVISTSLNGLFEYLEKKFKFEEQDDTDINKKIAEIKKKLDDRCDEMILSINQSREYLHGEIDSNRGCYDDLLQQKKTAFKDTVEKTSAIFYQKQNELKVFEKSLKEYKRIILNLDFEESNFHVGICKIGKITEFRSSEAKITNTNLNTSNTSSSSGGAKNPKKRSLHQTYDLNDDEYVNGIEIDNEIDEDMTPHDIAMWLKFQLEENRIDETSFLKNVLKNTTKRMFDCLLNEKRSWNDLSIVTRNSFKRIYIFLKNPDQNVLL